MSEVGVSRFLSGSLGWAAGIANWKSWRRGRLRERVWRRVRLSGVRLSGVRLSGEFAPGLDCAGESEVSVRKTDVNKSSASFYQ
jgi:hypothetical protein